MTENENIKMDLEKYAMWTYAPGQSTMASSTTATEVAYQHMMDAFSYKSYKGIPVSPTPAGATFRFHRINQKCSFTEGESFVEPLDELRLRTAKWLGRA